MKKITTFAAILLLIFCLQSCSYSTNLSDNETITVKVNTKNPGTEISPDTVGLSYEASRLLPDENGIYYFRPDNTALLNMFETLGIKNLRIGGNSVDAPNIPIPGEKEIHSFFKFAKEANVKVIYSVRLQDGDPKVAQNIAKVIYENYKDVMESFSIGNEPGYYKDYDVYTSKWTAIRDAILEVYPDAVFAGPDQNPEPERIKQIVSDFGNPAGRLVQVTQHNYPFGCSYRNPGVKDVNQLVPQDAARSREKMLMPSAYRIYDRVLRGMLEATKGTDVTFRMTETNSYWFSGLKGASDSYASALWALDYLHWWSSHGAAGLNFHTGDITGGAIALPCRYAAFVTSGSGYEARPLGYGMKLFALAGSGNSLDVEISSSDKNLAAYANLCKDKTVLLTLINKEYNSSEELSIRIRLDAPLDGSKVQYISMNAKNNDIAAGSDSVTLGGVPIENDGSWKGQWQILPQTNIKNNEISLTIPPACALIIKANIQ
ncbi:MAG: hypothetical protein JW715_00820 [Sedimentisphaerales bacterium]|nr:hypothetical protein [Sedimentisphaerales bacterium]